MIRELMKLDSQSLLGKLVRLPLKLIPRHRVLRVLGGLNKGAAWIAGSSTHGCWLGTYEADKQDLVAGAVRPGMVVWDVGANAGFYSIAFSRLVGPAGRVYAFEPLAENAGNLLAHVGLNKLGNVTVIQAAFSDATGLVGFRVAHSNSMGHVSPDEKAYLVPALTVDEFLRAHPEARPDLIKIDIEGGEHAMLAGGSRFLQEAAPEIVLALHGDEQRRACAALLVSFGYSLFHFDGAPVKEDPLRADEICARKTTG